MGRRLIKDTNALADIIEINEQGERTGTRYQTTEITEEVIKENIEQKQTAMKRITSPRR